MAPPAFALPLTRKNRLADRQGRHNGAKRHCVGSAERFRSEYLSKKSVHKSERIFYFFTFHFSLFTLHSFDVNGTQGKFAKANKRPRAKVARGQGMKVWLGYCNRIVTTPEEAPKEVREECSKTFAFRLFLPAARA